MGRRGTEFINLPDQRVSMLTTQNREVLKLTALGLDTDQIAQKLGLVNSTIKNQKHGIYKTLGVQTALKAITLCVDARVFTLKELTDCYPEETIRGARSLSKREITILEAVGFYGSPAEAAKVLKIKEQTVKNNLHTISYLLDLYGRGSTIQAVLIYKRALEVGIIVKRTGNEEEISHTDALSEIENAVNESTAKIASVVGRLARQHGNLAPIRITRIGDSTLEYDPQKNKLNRVPDGEGEGNEVEVFNGNDHPQVNDWINYGLAVVLKIPGRKN